MRKKTELAKPGINKKKAFLLKIMASLGSFPAFHQGLPGNKPQFYPLISFAVCCDNGFKGLYQLTFGYMAHKSMGFRFLPDAAIADLAFRAEGKTRGELFENCGLALTSAMADTSKIGSEEKRKFSVEGKDDLELLYNFLEELVYAKDVDGLLFKKFRVKFIRQENKKKSNNSKIRPGQQNSPENKNGPGTTTAPAKKLKLDVSCSGSSLEKIRGENLLNDVKAITMYLFGIKKERDKWIARVVVDI